MEISTIIIHALRKINLEVGEKIPDFFPINCSRINIVVGPNGGGKSTFIDLVRSVGDASVLSSLPRENMLSNTVSGFHISFDGGEKIEARFNCLDIDIFGVAIRFSDKFNNAVGYSGKMVKFSKDIDREIESVLKNISVNVYYRNLHDNTDSSPEEFIEVLNSHAKYLNGLAPFPLDNSQPAYKRRGFRNQYMLENSIAKTNSDRLNVLFNDDESQSNLLPISHLPSGWKAFGGVVAWLKRHTDCICVIEEPEVHLHPQLQRVLINQIVTIANQQNIQIFLTTHSPIFINASSISGQDITLIEANGYQVRAITELASSAYNLGVKPSDCLQTNGVIWVEGPSDRIYLLHWLRLFCHEKGVPMPIENLDFSFILYGGAALAHYTVRGADYGTLINMLKINSNCVVVMDRDFDFNVGVEHINEPKNIKKKIDADLKSDPNKFSWVTSGYTIESYLPSTFFSRYFEVSSGKVLLKSGYGKVKIAEKFASEFSDFYKSFDPASNLEKQLSEVFRLIEKWKS